MTKEEIQVKIDTLKDIQSKIQIEIDDLEKELDADNFSNKVSHSGYDKNTELGYYQYLTITKKLNDHTAHNYFSHLRGIRARLNKYSNFNLDSEIYNISDKDTLLIIKNNMALCKKLQEDNKMQHNAFTAAFNNYITYILKFYKCSDEKLTSEFIFDD